MSETTVRPRFSRSKAVRIALAAVALLGVGAAITTAAWTDDVFFSATATASSYDLQGSADGTTWADTGVPGETTDSAPIVITAAGLATLSPGVTVNVPFYLCNVGNTAGTITAVSTPVVGGPLGTAAGATLTATVVSPAVGTATPASAPACATPIVGQLQVTTTAAFPGAAQGLSGTISFSVTGTSS